MEAGVTRTGVPDPLRWKALTVVCAAFFMTILDVSIVNVALPSIETALDFSRANLQWVITAYAITYGGFLLLAGRLAGSVRAPAGVHHRRRHLLHRLALLRAGVVRGRAHRVARPCRVSAQR
jgi:MFS family permease